MSKSFVTMEQKACPISGEVFETNSLLLDRSLKESFDSKTISGYQIAPSIQEQLDKGFIALVEIDESKSESPYTPDTAYRTGQIAFLKREVAMEMFNTDIGDSSFVYVDEKVIDKLKQSSGQ